MTAHTTAFLRSTVADAVSDLRLIACNSPMERLPKEEQLRCSMYASLKLRCELVRVEGGYRDPDTGGKAECDLIATREGLVYWIELKRAWEAGGWVNKPIEQRDGWENDVCKLSAAPPDAVKSFILFGFFDENPARGETPLARAIEAFRPQERSFALASEPFCWRGSFAHVAAWGWLLK